MVFCFRISYSMTGACEGAGLADRMAELVTLNVERVFLPREISSMLSSKESTPLIPFRIARILGTETKGPNRGLNPGPLPP